MEEYGKHTYDYHPDYSFPITPVVKGQYEYENVL